MTTPILGLTEWTENQNQPHVPTNEMVRALEVFSSVVLALDYKEEPESGDEEEGSVFIIEPTGTGDFAAHDNEIAYYSDGLKFLPPREGMLAWIISAQGWLQYSELSSDGAGWYPASFETFESAGSGAEEEAEPYDVGSLINGEPSASQVLMRYPFPRTVTFVEDLIGSQGFCEVAATVDADFDIQKNGGSIGTMRFEDGETTAIFIFASEVAFAPGDVLSVIAPASPDATLADVGFALVGQRLIMALLFIDSFDHYATADAPQKWTAYESSSAGQAIASGTGRRSTNGWTSSAATRGLVKALPSSQATVIVGAAWYFATLPGAVTTFYNFYESATSHVQVRLNADGSITVARNTTGLATSAAGIITTGAFYYIEAKVTIGNAPSGGYEIRVNGANILSDATEDTQNGGTAVVTQVAFQVPTANCVVDDFYLCDTTGAVNNDFLGDVRCDCFFPNGNGNSSQLTGSDGNSTDNYLLVDETAPDGDTTYVESSTASQKDTYACGNMAHSPSTIHGVQVVASAKKDDAGARSITTVVRSDGADYDGATVALSTSYLMYSQVKETDPDTSAAWAKAAFDAAEFGVKVAA